jgi:Flp pilus assembly pilin Flp
LRSWLRDTEDEQGQTLVEYSLLIALIAVALAAGLMNFTSGVNGLYGVIQKVIDAIGG